MTTTLYVAREAEQNLLGCLMQDPSLVAQIRLEPGHFFDHRHVRIFSAISALAAANRPADSVSVFEHLGGAGRTEDLGGLEYLSALEMAVPSARNASHYADVVRERALHRAIMDAADAALEVAGGDGPADGKLDVILAKFGELQRGTMRKMPRRLADVMLERTAHYEALARKEISPGWATGIPTLDRRLGGGLKPGKVYVIAARPSVGKSSFAQWLCIRMATQGLPALFLSQEMENEELADRATASVGRIDFGDLQAGTMEDEAWARMVEAVEALRDAPLMVDDQGALTLDDVRAKARSVKGLKVLALDYLQLCAATGGRGDNRNAEIEEISRGIKALAKELGVAVLLLSQLNREVEKRASKRPVLADLRDSGAIEQDADVVMCLWPVRSFDDRRIVGCGIEKNRGGATGQFGLDFMGSTQRWAESTADIEYRGNARGALD